MSAIVKVFRMPADDGRGSELRGLGPAFENLQGRKSREGIRRRPAAGVTCIRPTAFAGDTSRWSNALSGLQIDRAVNVDALTPARLLDRELLLARRPAAGGPRGMGWTIRGWHGLFV